MCGFSKCNCFNTKHVYLELDTDKLNMPLF